LQWLNTFCNLDTNDVHRVMSQIALCHYNKIKLHTYEYMITNYKELIKSNLVLYQGYCDDTEKTNITNFLKMHDISVRWVDNLSVKRKSTRDKHNSDNNSANDSTDDSDCNDSDSGSGTNNKIKREIKKCLLTT